MKTLYIDADTIVYSSAAKEEILKCVATNTIANKSRTFESKTAFNNWFAENSTYDKSVYTFEVERELVGQESHAFYSVKSKIEGIIAEAGCDDFRICIGGAGNYRYDYQSKYVQYKAQRDGKPLLYCPTYEYVKRKYKDKVIIVNGEEVDDYLAKIGHIHRIPKGKVEDSPIVIAYVDKDLQQNIPDVPMLNYYHLEKGVFWNSYEDQYKGFWGSVLTGDAADNIPGIVSLGEATKKRYGIKNQGCGKASAARILCTTTSELECAERVIEAYKEVYPEDYMERLQDMCYFLWLRREEDQQFNLSHHLEQLGQKS